MVSIASDMTRLRGEITKGHQARVQLMGNLHVFADNLSCEVQKKLHRLTESRIKKTKHAATQRHEFVVDLHHNVASFLNDFATELKNARCGWYGETKTKSTMKENIKEKKTKTD